MSISAEEFEALQLQLIDLKEAKYESQDREKKLLHEIKVLKEHATTLENDLKKAQAEPSTKPFSAFAGVIKGSKDKKEIAALISENEALSRNLELATMEHKEQQEATMQNMKNIYSANKLLEEEVENCKKIILEKDRKIEAQEGQLRKFQVQLLQFETSADIHKLDSPFSSTPASSSPTPNGEEHPNNNKKDGEEGEGKGSDGAENHITAGHEENARLRENVRLLSTQMKVLDEQFSKSESSYRSQISTLEQQLTTCREKIKQDEISAARMEARLEEELSTVLKSKEELVTKLSSWEEQGKREKALSDQIDQLKEQVADLSDNLTTTKVSRDEYMEQVKRVTSECESITQAKNTLDAQFRELETEAELLRQVRDDHSVALSELEITKTTAKNTVIALDRANAECVELAERKKELEQLKHELATITAQANQLQTELDAVKAEAENLRNESSRVSPLEQELDGLKLAHLQAITESSAHKDQYEAERQKYNISEVNVQDLTIKLAEANEQVASLTSQVNKLQTEKQDLATDHIVQERKSQRMIKELKSELHKERSTTNVSRSASMDQIPSVPPSPAAPSTPRHSPPMSPVPLTPPHAPRMTRHQADAVNTLPLLSASLSNMELSQATMEEVLRRDLDTALTMVGKLGEDKWKLEEKARFLEENFALVNEDLVRKTKVIQYYVSKTKQSVTTEQLTERDKGSNRKQSGVLGTLMRSGADQHGLSAELLSRMEAVLEETVLKNIQLQNDMATLGNETGILQKDIKQLKEENKQLANENNHYKDQLLRVMSSPRA